MEPSAKARRGAHRAGTIRSSSSESSRARCLRHGWAASGPAPGGAEAPTHRPVSPSWTRPRRQPVSECPAARGAFRAAMSLLQGCAAARSVEHPSASATVERSRQHASSRVSSAGSGLGRGGLGLPNREAAEESARSTRRAPLTSHRLALVSATDAFIARVLFTRERSCSCASRIQRVSESSLHTRQRQRCLSRQARSRVRRRQRVQRSSPGVTASASASPGCHAP